MKLNVGEIISVEIYGFVDHWGVVTDVGTVISASKRAGKVVEQSLGEFLEGRNFKRIGYPGRLAPQQVIARARSALGEVWQLDRSNCQHFGNWAHGLERRSPQLEVAVLFVFAVAGLLLLKGR